MNVKELLIHYGVEVAPARHRHVRAGWCGIDCPLCSPGTRKFRFGINLVSGRSSCWVCGRQDTLKILSTVCNQPVSKILANWDRKPSAFESPVKQHEGTLQMPAAGDLHPSQRRYLENRGFDPDELVRTWGIKGIGMASRLSWRILIPIYDHRGKIVSWTTRSISEDPSVPRYISAKPSEESQHHKHLLYGAHLAKCCVVVCEGPISAWAIGPGAVATCGLGYTREQLEEIAEYPYRATCFDATPEAQRRAKKLCEDLAPLPGVTENILLETGKDPAECDKEETEAIRQQFLFNPSASFV